MSNARRFAGAGGLRRDLRYQSAAPDPTLLAGATVIVDARNIVGVADAATVATWIDSSGNSKDATQTTAGSRPVYRASVSSLNSKPAVEFARLSSQFMSFPTLDATGRDWTVFAVLDMTSTNQQRVFDAQAGRLTFDNATPGAVGYFDGTLKTAGTSATGAQCLTWVCKATASGAIYRGRTALGTGLGYATQLALAGTYVTLGAGSGGASLFLDAKVSAFAIYPTAFSAAQLAAQWDIIDSVWGVAP